MADIAHLGFSVDTSGLVRAERALDSLSRASRGLRGVNLPVNLTGAAEARRSIDSIGLAASGLRDISVRVRVDGRQASNELRGVASAAQQSAQHISQSIANVRSQMLGLIGATSAVAAGVNVIEMADEYKNLDAKLRLVTKSQQEFADVQGKLTAMADANRQSVGATINLYSGIAPSLQKAGQSQANILKAVDSVNKALVVGGSNAVGSAASILQLTQALGSGVLRGDEFNSIMENGRGIAMMLADALHTDTGKLRGLAEQGKLTAEIVTAALIEQNAVVTEKFAKMPVTVGQAMQVVKNNLLAYVGETDSASGATAALSSALLALSGNLSTVANMAGALAAVYAGRMVAGLTASVGANLAASAAIRARGAAELATAAQTAQAAYVSADAKAIHTAMLVREAEAAVAAASGMARLRVVQMSLIPAQAAAATAASAATAALAAQTAALNAQAAASGFAATAARGLNAALMLIGGPIGALFLAATAAVVYREELMGLVTYSGRAEKSAELHADAMAQAKKSAYEYADASKELREQLDGQKKSALDAARASVEEAKAAVEAARTKLSVAETMADGGSDAATFSGFGSTDSETRAATHAETMLAAQSKALAELEKSYSHFGETKAELDKSFVDDTKPALDEVSKASANTALEMLNTGKATKEAAKALHDHGDAMQQATESITQRTLAVEHGVLAEQYYIERMKGVTDAEARRIVSGNQYLTYLEEQQSLTKDATAAHGGLLDAYRQKLDDAGLGSADKAFNAAKSSTDVAVDAAVRYRESIEAVTQAAKEAAAAVATIGTTSGSSVSGASVGNAGTTNITGAAASTASAVVSKLQALGWGKNQAIGIAANLKQESEFSPSAVGDGGKAYGLAQWHPDRQANFAKAMGRSIQGSSVDDQLKFLTYEMTKGTERGAGNRLKDASSVAQAAAIVSRYYERPAATAEEMTRRAGIANGIAKSLGDAVPTFRAVTDETSKTADSATKVATAIGSNIPVLAETKSLTVEYGGVIEDKVVTAQMRANLEQQYMNGEAQKLIDTANEQAETIGKSGIAIRQNELNQKQFNASQQVAIINAESALAYAEEEANLRKEMAAVKSPGLAAQYADGLSDKTLTKDRIESLTGQKLQIEFTKNITELDGRAEKATLTAEAYQRLTLVRDGFTQAQINGQMAWQQEVLKLEDAAEANSRIAQSFESDLAGALKSGELNFQGFADTVISEITRLQVIKPLMESLFGADKSGKSGLFGGSDGGIVQTIGSFLGFANGGAFAASGVQAYANGGAFHNSVLSRPTQFFANGGLAVAGEAGAEAVMPLTRIGGKLGVQSTGAGVVVQPQIRINIVNNAGAKVETQQQTDNDGNINMTVMINQIEGAISDRARRGQGLANVFKRVG